MMSSDCLSCHLMAVTSSPEAQPLPCRLGFGHVWEVRVPRGKHRPKPLLIAHTWEHDRTQYARPTLWTRLVSWVRHAKRW
jgi:hypothetical protein